MNAPCPIEFVAPPVEPGDCPSTRPAVGRRRYGDNAGFVLLILPAILGCGNGLAQVTGTVTLDGQPLRGGGDVRAMVYLHPEGGTGAPAVALIDESGQYRVSTGAESGVLPGPYLVSISASQLTGDDAVGVPRSGRRITPDRYADPRTSGLRIDVGAGENTYDFELEFVHAESRH